MIFKSLYSETFFLIAHFKSVSTMKYISALFEHGKPD